MSCVKLIDEARIQSGDVLCLGADESCCPAQEAPCRGYKKSRALLQISTKETDGGGMGRLCLGSNKSGRLRGNRESLWEFWLVPENWPGICVWAPSFKLLTVGCPSANICLFETCLWGLMWTISSIFKGLGCMYSWPSWTLLPFLGGGILTQKEEKNVFGGFRAPASVSWRSPFIVSCYWKSCLCSVLLCSSWDCIMWFQHFLCSVLETSYLSSVHL